MKRTRDRSDRKAAKTTERPTPQPNRMLTQQNRKLLGKHYANKYRAGAPRSSRRPPRT